MSTKTSFYFKLRKTTELKPRAASTIRKNSKHRKHACVPDFEIRKLFANLSTKGMHEESFNQGSLHRIACAEMKEHYTIRLSLNTT